jgi:hypothetical protein
MMTFALGLLKKYWFVVVALVAILAIGYVGYGCGQRSRDDALAALATKLAQSEKTSEIKDDLYATSIIQIDDLTKLLDTKQAEVLRLKQQLDQSQAQLLATEELVVRWKKAYEGVVNAHQSDGGTSPTDPTIVRKRVDFDGSFGPIAVVGHTLTDPPEGYVSITQTRPLKLTVAVTRNRDGTWGSLVTSSEPNMAVDVVLGGVNPGILSPTWRQRIWVDAGVDFLMGQSASLGASYHFGRFSLGASCSAWSDGHGCGLTVGYRPFK